MAGVLRIVESWCRKSSEVGEATSAGKVPSAGIYEYPWKTASGQTEMVFFQRWEQHVGTFFKKNDWASLVKAYILKIEIGLMGKWMFYGVFSRLR